MPFRSAPSGAAWRHWFRYHVPPDLRATDPLAQLVHGTADVDSTFLADVWLRYDRSHRRCSGPGPAWPHQLQRHQLTGRSLRSHPGRRSGNAAGRQTHIATTSPGSSNPEEQFRSVHYLDQRVDDNRSPKMIFQVATNDCAAAPERAEMVKAVMHNVFYFTMMRPGEHFDVHVTIAECVPRSTDTELQIPGNCIHGIMTPRHIPVNDSTFACDYPVGANGVHALFNNLEPTVQNLRLTCLSDAVAADYRYNVFASGRRFASPRNVAGPRSSTAFRT